MDVGEQHTGPWGPDSDTFPADHLQPLDPDQSDRAGTIRAVVSSFEIDGHEHIGGRWERVGQGLAAFGHGRYVQATYGVGHWSSLMDDSSSWTMAPDRGFAVIRFRKLARDTLFAPDLPSRPLGMQGKVVR